MEKSQVHQVHFSWYEPTHLSFSISGSVSVGPACRHSPSPSFCHSCQGHHSHFCLKSFKCSQLSHFSLWSQWIFWASAIPQIGSSYQLECFKWNQEQRHDYIVRCLMINTSVLFVMISSYLGQCPAHPRFLYTSMKQITYQPIHGIYLNPSPINPAN